MGKQQTARRLPPAQVIEQALQLHRAGRLKKADKLYRAVLASDPGHFDALHLSGMVAHQQGRLVEALRRVAAALNVNPGSADALTNYGVILEAQHRHQEALDIFDQALARGAATATLHYNRGNALNALGRHEEALASFDKALAIAPTFAVAHHNRGSALAALDRHEEALESYDRSLSPSAAAVEPANDALAEDCHTAAALNNRGTVLTKLKRYDEAFASFDKALALRPDYADALCNRGLALADLGRYDEALAHYERALRINPNFGNAHFNRGNAYLALNRLNEAVASYRAAAALEPDNADIAFNEALARLCMGDFREGWKKYEYRWTRKKNPVQRPVYPRPLWRGETDLNGKVILLCCEQGMGDTIQFVRYAPLLAELGAKVLLGVHGPLTDLMRSVPGISQVFADGETLPHFDLYCPLLSLPMLFGTELSSIPARVPYIRPYQERVAQWRERVPDNGRLRVGICWAGTSAHLNDRQRSIPLETFAAILSVPGLDLISLQKDVDGRGAEILRRHGVAELGRDFADFADTAAVMTMLDLVISVDTSVAHLAGAMAKAVAVLVAFSPDWRWMLERTDTPWYPTMRLFRQPAIGDWDAPLARLRQELEALARTWRKAPSGEAATA
jgi:tetratricopeptide (TPR) repeat protein